MNGYLFADPVSGNWYAYVGHYPAGYAMGPGKRTICTVYRSKDEGQSWDHIGPVFPEEPFFFEGDSAPVERAPDVSVVYHEGRYHMAYDWATGGATWQRIREGMSGASYAWSERPEGPFYRAPRPILRNGVAPWTSVLGKYNRFYASTLIRRQGDWLLLTIIDSGPHFAWGLVATTAKAPQGPYGPPIPLFHVEGDRYQPPLMEYFPSFLHEGWVYAPSTSVALNRNFQMMQRAPLEAAAEPEAWELYRHGSIWHAEDVENETFGIWGQTISGFVDDGGQFRVLFPSRDSQGNGTINLASCPWEQPFRERGFTLSGHEGPSLTLIRCAYETFRLRAELRLRGTASVFWASTGPLGPDAPRSNATLHALCHSRRRELVLKAAQWQLVTRDEQGAHTLLGSGSLARGQKRTVEVEQSARGQARVAVDGAVVWEGPLEPSRGSLGLIAEAHSHLSVDRFLVAGEAHPAVIPLLYTEGLLGAGENVEDWDLVNAPQFRYGVGAIHRSDGGRAKWNYHGQGFTLWAPKGPEYSTTEVLVDGVQVGTVDLYAPAPAESRPLLTLDDVEEGFHAVVLRATSGPLVVDSLDVHTCFSP